MAESGLWDIDILTEEIRLFSMCVRSIYIGRIYAQRFGECLGTLALVAAIYP